MRQRHFVLSRILVAAAVLAGALLVSGHKSSAATCDDVLFIGARGSGEPKLQSQQNMGATVFKTYSSLVTLLSGQRKITPRGLTTYPAVKITLANIPRAVQASAATGTEEAIRIIRAIPSTCQTRVVLVGFSQGAWAVGDALFGLTPTEESRIAAVVFFGDPMYDPTSPIDAYSRLASGVAASVLGPRSPYVPTRYTGISKSYCRFLDPVCSWVPEPLHYSSLAACGVKAGFACPHFHYVDQETSFAAQFIASLLRRITETTSTVPPPTATVPPPGG
jgi:Cutinase